MIRTITSEKIIVPTAAEESTKLQKEEDSMEPSETTIANILNYSKALQPMKGKKDNVVLRVMN